jgi:ribonuclease HI
VAQTACKPELKVVEGGVVRDVTHQEMEVTAALKAVEWGFAESPKARLTIISDSYYVVGCFEHEWHVKWEQRGWRTSSGRPVKYPELWKPLLNLVFSMPCTPRFVHVRGHKGHPGNKAADEACTEAMRHYASNKDEMSNPSSVKGAQNLVPSCCRLIVFVQQPAKSISPTYRCVNGTRRTCELLLLRCSKLQRTVRVETRTVSVGCRSCSGSRRSTLNLSPSMKPTPGGGHR